MMRALYMLMCLPTQMDTARQHFNGFSKLDFSHILLNVTVTTVTSFDLSKNILDVSLWLVISR